MKLIRSYKGDFIQGQFRKVGDPNGEIFSYNPGDLEAPRLSIPFAYESVHEAVNAAKLGFSAWRMRSAADRLSAVSQYLQTMRKRAEEISRHISFEVGKPIWESRQEVADTLEVCEEFLQMGSQTSVEIEVNDAGHGSMGRVRFLPRGVMGVISPANLPFFAPHVHFIPALIHGNCVVLKSSKSAPVVGQYLSDIFHESGFPASVFHVIHGDAEVARRLACHPAVDGVLFAGSHETGMKLQKQAATDPWKLLVLEMGGKNGIVIWEDCNYEEALYEAMVSAYFTTGQRFSSASRLLVHKKIFDRFLKDFHALSKKIRVGYAFDDGEKAPFMGPLLSEASTESYLRYQGIAVREGCEEIMRGKQLDRDRKGHYVSPSIHVVPAVDPKSVYQRNEVYAPNVAFYQISDIDEAVEILNMPQHSLVASVYTRSREIYLRVLEETRVGMLNWNHPTITFSQKLPRGGIFKSGNNRPMGSFSGYQCTFPMASLEQKTPFDVKTLPKEMPRLETK